MQAELSQSRRTLRWLLIPMHVNKLLSVFSIALADAQLGSSPALAHGKGLYATEAEAQTRAKELGCTTTHQIQYRWMPCADEQELHQKLRQR